MGPFCRHIVDAIWINLKRLFLYGKLSFGLSVPISVGLISFEVSILPLAFYYDLINSLVWKKKGWGLLNEDFIDMKWTPEFRTKATDIPSGEFSFIPVAIWRKRINQILKEGEWENAYKALKAIREGMSLAHKTHPLMHHFLESVHRCVALTCQWKSENPEIAKNSIGKKFLKHRCLLVWWQMVGFEGALMLDALAWPLRKKGLLILEQDVPVIPVPDLR